MTITILRRFRVWEGSFNRLARSSSAMFLIILICVVSLPTIGCSPPTVNELIGRLDVTSVNPEFESQYIQSLVKIGKPAVDPLIAVLDHKNWLVRRGAAEALGKIKDPRAVEPLIRVLANRGMIGKTPMQDDYSRVTLLSTVATALGDIGDSRAIKPLAASMADIHQWKYGASSVQEALVKIGQPAVDPLVETMGVAQTHRAVNEIISTLLKIGDPRAVEPIIAILERQDPEERPWLDGSESVLLADERMKAFVARMKIEKQNNQLERQKAGIAMLTNFASQVPDILDLSSSITSSGNARCEKPKAAIDGKLLILNMGPILVGGRDDQVMRFMKSRYPQGISSEMGKISRSRLPSNIDDLSIIIAVYPTCQVVGAYRSNYGGIGSPKIKAIKADYRIFVIDFKKKELLGCDVLESRSDFKKRIRGNIVSEYMISDSDIVTEWVDLQTGELRE